MLMDYLLRELKWIYFLQEEGSLCHVDFNIKQGEKRLPADAKELTSSSKSSVE
jgi:hypothetical protein